MFSSITVFIMLFLTGWLWAAPCLGRMAEHRDLRVRSEAARHTRSPPVATALPLPPPPPEEAAASSGPPVNPPAPKVVQAAHPAAKGRVTGLPLPRFASLRADTVNMRVGPGQRYPIKWVYKRRDLPVEIQREFEAWRFVEDADGIKGWMHQATLTRRRSFIVLAPQRALRSEPRVNAPPVALLDPGVIGWLVRCGASASWCEVRVDGYRGWLPRRAFWGTLQHEAIRG